MRTTIILAVCLVLFVSVPLVPTKSDPLLRITLNNRSQQRIFIVVHDRVCGIKAFEGEFAIQGKRITRICPDDRGLGHIVISNPRGRQLRFDNLRPHSQVSVRFR